MQRGEQVEESVGRVGRHQIARSAQLLPDHQLAGQEGKGEHAAGNQAALHPVCLAPIRRGPASIASATLASTSTAVFSHSSHGSGNGFQSASPIRIA